MINVDFEIAEALQDRKINELSIAGNLIKKVVEECILSIYFEKKHYEWEVFVLLTDDKDIREINNEIRGIDKPTDVLSFPLLNYVNGKGSPSKTDIDPDTGRISLGDIIISIERTIAQAEEYEHSFARELAFLVSHGMFHLFGYDHLDAKEEKNMIEAQEKIIEPLGYGRE